MQPKGHDYRDFVKIKSLIFLAKVREQQGEKAVMSSGEIARRTHNSYNSIRVLLRRWSQHSFVYDNHKLGKTQIKKGYGYCHEVLARNYGANYKYGYRITAGGLRYLANQEYKHPYFQEAINEVIRYTGRKVMWKDPLLDLYFYIRPPFSVNEDCNYSTEPNTEEKANLIGASSMEEAFQLAQQINPPPGKAFRAYCFHGINLMRQKAAPQMPPLVDNPIPPSKPGTNYRFRINPEGAKRLAEALRNPHANTDDDNVSGL
jgi:hypothetical protein